MPDVVAARKRDSMLGNRNFRTEAGDHSPQAAGFRHPNRWLNSAGVRFNRLLIPECGGVDPAAGQNRSK